MSIHSPIAAAAFILSACAFIAPAQAQSNFYGKAEALFLTRDQDFGGPLVFDENTMDFVLTGNDLDFDVMTGVRLTFGAQLTDSCAVEAIYFGSQHWNDSQRLYGDNNLSIPGDLGLATTDFFAADSIAASYDSTLNNIEFNGVHQFGSLSLLAGVRFLELNENFNISSFDNTDTFNSNYLIDTDNRLYGGQLGAMLSHTFGIVGLYAAGKAGIYANDNKQDTLVRDLGNTLTFRDVEQEGTSTAFVGELNFGGEIKLVEGLFLIGGYNLLWVENVALAPEQLDFTDTPSSSMFVNDNGSVFYHGASAGIKAVW